MSRTDVFNAQKTQEDECVSYLLVFSEIFQYSWNCKMEEFPSIYELAEC